MRALWAVGWIFQPGHFLWQNSTARIAKGIGNTFFVLRPIKVVLVNSAQASLSVGCKRVLVQGRMVPRPLTIL
jgi:hypothetical protein